MISKQATKLFEVVKCHPTVKELQKDFTKLYKSKVKWTLVWISVKDLQKNNLCHVDFKFILSPELGHILKLRWNDQLCMQRQSKQVIKY